MKTVASFIKNTLIGGALIILPLALIAILLRHIVDIAHKILKPIASQISDNDFFPYMIAAVLVFLACFLAGLIIRTSPGRRFGAFLERRLYERVPGYKVLKAIGGGFLADSGDRGIQPAFVEIEEGLAPAFIMKKHADGSATVFVPTCPTPAVGSLYVFPGRKVHAVDVPMAKLVGCISAWGLGAKDLLPARVVGRLES